MNMKKKNKSEKDLKINEKRYHIRGYMRKGMDLER